MRSRHFLPFVPELPSYQVREYRPGDEVGILAAFNRIFAAVDVTFRPRTMEQWRWLYERNPAGRRIFLAITEEGRVLAQYAGVPQRMRIGGGPGFFSQSVDSMSDPEFRRGLTREPLFVQVGRAFDAHFGGSSPDKDTLMWGLPVPVAFRIGKKQLKYELVRQQPKLSARCDALTLPAAGGVTLEEAAAFPDEVDGLFERLAAERGALAVRDRAHLCWRFEENPYHRYRIGLARRGGELAGFALFRKGSFDLIEDGLLADWLAPAGDEGVRAALLDWARRCAREAGCERLVTVFPDTSPEWLSFQDAGFRVASTRYFVVAWSFAPRYDLRWMYRHWYYTLGDTDLV